MNMNFQVKAGRMPKLAVVMLAGALAMVMGAVGPLSQPKVTQALCFIPNPGDLRLWTNINPNTRSITKARIGFECGDLVICDPSGHCTIPWTGYTLRLYGKCHPTDCDWGTVRATYDNATKTYKASYTQSFAQRKVTAKRFTSGIFAGLLQVTVATHFTDGSGRPDYTSVDYLH